MRKNLFILGTVLTAFALTGCGGNNNPAKKLGTVTNINYEDGILSFTPVEGATKYKYEIYHKTELVFDQTITDTALDIDASEIYGSLTAKITAKNETSTGDAAQYSFVSLKTFSDEILEAENYLYNFGTGKENSNFRNNPLASNGAYVGGLDDAGQGIYINYLCPEAGTYEVESHYCYHPTVPGITKAHHDIWVNDVYQDTFEYTVDTGWGGAKFEPEISTANLTLVKGWNVISIMKDGDETDNWGDFAEIDFIKIKGNGTKYNIDDLEIYGDSPAFYRLEAEMGSPRKKGESGLYECKNPCIKQSHEKEYSNGFLMGGIENKYDGVEWHFNSPVKAKYNIKIAYASGIFDGSKKAAPSFVVSDVSVALSKNIDFLDLNPQTMDPLDYTGWNVPTVATQSIELTLEQGDNFIYCLLLEGSGFFQIDYCDLTFVSEIE